MKLRPFKGAWIVHTENVSSVFPISNYIDMQARIARVSIVLDLFERHKKKYSYTVQFCTDKLNLVSFFLFFVCF